MQTAARSMTFPEFMRFRTERGVADAVLEAARNTAADMRASMEREIRRAGMVPLR